MATTNITVKAVPGYPSVRIINRSVDRSHTWAAFLRTFNVKLDPAWFLIYNNTRKLFAFLDDPISVLMSNYRRKTSLSVTIKKLEKPNYIRRPDQRQAEVRATASTPGTSAAAARNRRFPEDNMPNSSVTPGPVAYDDEDNDDAVSQLSQGDDDDGDGVALKEQLRLALERIPPNHLTTMREELLQLKSGAGRDYKWSHYAPRTSVWVMSAFKV